MKKHTVKTKNGETLELYYVDVKHWCCPVCGSPELNYQPYPDEGGGSFEMCSCDFEFGYDDEPAASKEAIPGIKNNWHRWRKRLFSRYSHNPAKLNKLKSQLEAMSEA